MPLATRNVSKGIPPREHLPPKAKKVTGSKSRSQKKTKNKKNKRTASSDSDEGDDVVNKRKSSKRQHINESDESDLEIVDNDVGAPDEEVEEVNIIGDTVENEANEVSTTFY